MYQTFSQTEPINKTRHVVLIIVGCLIWCLSFFGEMNKAQPYSTIGIIISPVITIIGIFYWFKYYRKSRGFYPKFKTVWSNMYGTGNGFTFKLGFLLTHILEFWTICILFWMVLTLLFYLGFGRSSAFNATKEYCRTNKEVISKTGKIKYFGILVEGSISTHHHSGEADLTFTIIGEKGKFNADAELTKENDKWLVEDVTLK